jgi:hypothetical protein
MVVYKRRAIYNSWMLDIVDQDKKELL